MDGFCLQLDKLVRAEEPSGAPKNHLSCEFNSKLTPLDGMGLQATGGCTSCLSRG